MIIPKKKQNEFALQLLHMKPLIHIASSLSEFLAHLECTLMQVENLGCDLDSSSLFISPVLMEKLPGKTVEMIRQKNK